MDVTCKLLSTCVVIIPVCECRSAACWQRQLPPCLILSGPQSRFRAEGSLHVGQETIAQALRIVDQSSSLQAAILSALEQQTHALGAVCLQAMKKIGLKTPPSGTAETMEEAMQIADEIGTYPLIIRPAFTLGGSGGGIAYNVEEFNQIVESGLQASVTTQACPQCPSSAEPHLQE